MLERGELKEQLFGALFVEYVNLYGALPEDQEGRHTKLQELAELAAADAESVLSVLRPVAASGERFMGR